MSKRERVKKEQTFRKRVLALSTALLSDALGKTGAMDHDMRCRSAKYHLAGPAMTLRVHTADILMVGKAVAVCSAGKVLVIDGQGELNTALWGGIITVAARRKGIAGVVIDGAIRDSDEIAKDTLPVFARAVVPNAGGAEYTGEIEVPIQCGGVVVQPGDWVAGDRDGITVVPLDRLEEVLEKAERLKKVEREIEREIARGKDLAELLRYDEALKQKAAKGLLPQLRFSKK